MKAYPVGITFAVLCLAGCSKSVGPPPVATVVIDKMAYGPPPQDLRVGETLIWSNRDVLQHSATARDGSFDVDLPPRATRSVTLTRAGTINVFCRYHPDMKLRLSVEPRG